MNNVPNVLYIGLQKTGSTFLRHYFWNHSDVYCDRHGIFFQSKSADVDGRNIDDIRSDYASLFPSRPHRPCHIDMYEALGMGYLFREHDAWDGKTFINPEGTLTTGPLRPEPEEVARRIHTILPNAKILITIRNQISWLDSSYRHYFAHLPKNRCQFIDFIASPEGKISLDAGHFDRLISTYDRYFGQSNVCVLPLEAMEEFEDASLKKLSQFLGIPAIPYAPEHKNLNRGQNIEARSRTKIFSRWRSSAKTQLISSEIVETLRCAFSAGNVRLQKRLGIDMQSMGYPI